MATYSRDGLGRVIRDAAAMSLRWRDRDAAARLEGEALAIMVG